MIVTLHGQVLELRAELAMLRTANRDMAFRLNQQSLGQSGQEWMEYSDAVRSYS
jgi:hypothetical protein